MQSKIALTPTIVSLLAVFAFLLVLNLAISGPANNDSTNTVACTLEAKICPDGSAVGRTGPNCEFAACPDAVGNTNEMIYCAQDVKTCPDGSYVSRQAPSCEFAACPGS